MTSELTVETRDVEGVTLLYPKGFINAHTVRVFEGEIQKALAQGQFKIVVNCAGLAYIASAGLGALRAPPGPASPFRSRARRRSWAWCGRSRRRWRSRLASRPAPRTGWPWPWTRR